MTTTERWLHWLMEWAIPPFMVFIGITLFILLVYVLVLVWQLIVSEVQMWLFDRKRRNKYR